MLLSIVTGTFSRLPYLKQMIASARASLPRGMAYEFVIVDGGSEDGTIDWCKSQSDIRLIEQGELLGAIRAFDAGAYDAAGEYVLLANDDVVFHVNSIVPALVHLETHPEVGAVAFQDNRPAPGYGDGYKVQHIEVQDTDGRTLRVPYAQVGLFRKWLGNKALWWGSQHPVMSQGHTYGGDNFLSARLYELGYTIDVLDACKIDDLVPPDGLRALNGHKERENPAVYYKVYPTPPVFAHPPTIANPQTERLRVLYLPIYEPFERAQQEHKRGLREALARQGIVYEIDYVNTPYDLAAAVREFQPHLLLLQAHGPASIPVGKLREARRERPEMIVVNWNGDVYEKMLTSPAMIAYLRHVDLQLTVNANVLPTYAELGIPAAYWQVSYEPVNKDEIPTMPAHDVVWLANCRSERRRTLGGALQSLSGVNVGIYGRGWRWANGECTYDFPAGAGLYQNAKIALGDNEFPDQYGFVSNRIFEALSNGAFLLHQPIPGLQELTGITEGVHYATWQDVDDLQKQIRYWLMPRRDQERKAIAAAGQAYVREHHNFDVRVQELFTLIQSKVGQGRQVA